MKQTLSFDGGNIRPDECSCGDFVYGTDDDLPCWPCYQQGFRTRPAGWDDE